MCTNYQDKTATHRKIRKHSERAATLGLVCALSSTSVILLSSKVRPSSWHKVHSIRFTADGRARLIGAEKSLGRTEAQFSACALWSCATLVGILVGALMQNATPGSLGNDTTISGAFGHV